MPARKTMTPEEFEHFMADLQSGKLYRQMDENFAAADRHLAAACEAIQAILDRAEIVPSKEVEIEVITY